MISNAGRFSQQWAAMHSHLKNNHRFCRSELHPSRLLSGNDPGSCGCERVRIRLAVALFTIAQRRLRDSAIRFRASCDIVPRPESRARELPTPVFSTTRVARLRLAGGESTRVRSSLKLVPGGGVEPHPSTQTKELIENKLR